MYKVVAELADGTQIHSTYTQQSDAEARYCKLNDLVNTEIAQPRLQDGETINTPATLLHVELQVLP